jgi:hypothetical protein
MYSLIALALALTDTSKVDSLKVQEAPKVTFSHSGRMSMPSDHGIIVKVAMVVKAPEKLTTCYSSQYGSCWSEN